MINIDTCPDTINCSTCILDIPTLTPICLTCPTGYFLISGECNIIPTCTGSTYLNITNNTCMQCPNGCSSCSIVLTADNQETNILNCTGCNSHYYSLTNSTTNTSVSPCQQCPDNCLECQYNTVNNLTYCISCQVNEGLNDVLGSCQNCNTGCSSCELNNRQINEDGTLTTLVNYLGNGFNLSNGIDPNCVFCQSNAYYYAKVFFIIKLISFLIF